MADIRIVPAQGAINVTGSADFKGDSASTVLYVSGSGNVGVGTSNPISKLHVAGAIKGTATTGHVLGTSTDTSRALSILNSGLADGGSYAVTLGYGASNHNQAELTFYLAGTGSASNRVGLGLYNSPDTISVLGNGNVGIGKTNPVVRLDVNSDVRTSTRYLIATGNTNEDAAIGFWDGSNFRIEAGAAKPMLITSYQGNINLGMSGGTTMNVTSTSVNVTGVVSYGNAAASRGALSYGTSGLVTLEATSANTDIAILPSGTGKVGIGVTSPDAIFHVAKSTSGGVGGQVVIDNPASSTLGNAAELSFLTDAGASGAGTRNAKILAVNVNAGNGAAEMQFHTWNGAAELNRLNIAYNGVIKLGAYGSGGVTGTAAYNLSVDSSGNIIETANTSLTGTGTANYVTKWSSTTALTNSVIYDTGTAIGIGVTTPPQALSVYGNIYQRTGDYITWNNGDAQIGAVSGYALAFSTYDGSSSMVERMRITSAGSVGIGTTSPSANLDIKGVADTTGSISLQLRSGNSSDDFGSNQITLGYNNTANYRHAIKTRHHDGNYINAIDFYLWKYGTDTATTIGSQHVMTLIQGASGVADTGRMGIGTTSPNEKLQVAGNINAYAPSGIDAGLFASTSGGSTTIAIRSSGVTHFNGGNVGIGSTAPGYKLDVVGTGRISSTAYLNSDTYIGGDTYAVGGVYFDRGSSDYSTFVRANGYPAGGFANSAGSKYWLEVGGKGGVHVILNTDGGAGSAENAYDHFTVWQGSNSGDRLFYVTNTGNVTTAGNLTVNGIITAREFHTTFVSASIIYQSGSTQFGNSSDDTHIFSGSIGLNGSDPNFPFFVSDPSTAGSRYNLANKGMGFNLADDYAQLQLYGGNGGYIDFTNAAEDYDARIIYYGSTRLELIYGKNIAITGTGVGIGVTNPSYHSHIYSNSDIWHTAIGGDTGILRIGGQTSSGAVIQAFNPTTSAVRDLYIQRDGGNVGIGTTNPAATLQINGAGGDATPSLRIISAASNTFNWASSAEYANLATGETVIHLFGKANSTNNQAYVGYRHVSDGSSGNMLTLGLYAADYLMNLTAAGNVGIGSTAPTNKLQVVGGVTATSFTGSLLGDVVGNVTGNVTGTAASETLATVTGRGNTTTSNIGIGVTTTPVNLTIGKNTTGSTGFLDYIKIGSDLAQFGNQGGYPSLLIGTFGVYDASIATQGNDLRILAGRGVNTEDHNIRFYTSFNGTGGAAEDNERMRITYTGNVGIGVSAPNAKLNVFGAVGDGSTTVTQDLLHIGGNELGGVGGYAGIRLAGTGTTSYGVYIRGVKTLAYGNYWNDALTFSVTRNNTETTIDEVMRITADSKVGIGTTNPVTRLHIGAEVADDNSYTYDSNTLMAVHQTPTGTSTLNDPKEVLFLARQGTSGEAYGAAASFRLSRYENAGGSSVGSRTRLDLLLAHDAFFNSAPTVMSFYSNGNVGIGITAPAARLEIASADGNNDEKLQRWTYYAPTPTSYYLDLKQTVTTGVVRYNFSMVNGGTAYNDILVLDRGNVGIGTTNPAYKLDVNGTTNINGTAYVTGFTNTGTSTLASQVVIAGNTNSSNTSMYDAYVDGGSSYFQAPPALIRMDSSATGGIDEAPVALFIHNENGTDNTWTKLSLGAREAAGAGNSVSVAGIAAQKTSGTANAWASGDLHLWTKSGSTQVTNMVLTSSGNVGIGIGTPSAKLEVNGAVFIPSTSAFYMGGTAGSIGSWGSRQVTNSGTHTLSAGAFSIDNSGYVSPATSSFYVNTITSNVGINSTSPGNFSGLSFAAPILDIVASVNIRGRAADGAAVLNIGGETYRKAALFTSIQDAAPFLGFAIGTSGTSSSTTERMRITSGGNVGIGMTNPASVLDINYRDSSTNIVRVSNGSGAYRWRIDQFFDMYMTNASVADTVGIKNNGEAFFTGNVGIGTTAPFSKLQVGSNTFSGGNGMYSNSRVGISNHGSLTGLMLASTYNDATYPEYGLVFVQGPTTSDYNVWSVSPDGPLKGSNLNFIYGYNATNIHVGAPVMVLNGANARVGIGTASPNGKLDIAYDMFTGNADTELEASTSVYGNINFRGVTAQGAGSTATTQQGITWQINNYSGTTNYGNQAQLVVGNNGNVGTFMGFFTSDNYGAAPVERLRIQYNGNVGIGLTNPSTKLEVNGNIKLSSTVGATATPSYIWLGNDYSNGTTRDKLKIYLYNSGTEQYGFSVGNIADVQYHSNVYHDFYTANSLSVRINGSGNVGIGTTSPGEKLVVYGGSIEVRGTTYPSLGLYTTSGTNWGITNRYTGNRLSIDVIGTGEVVNILSNGNVGIGPTAPGAYLDVKGAADTSGLVALQLRAGNSSDNFSSNQITFGYGNTEGYRHAIKTRHHSNDYVNAIDFYVWKYGTDATGTIGTQHVMTIIQGGAGSPGNGRVGIGTTAPAYQLEVNGITKSGIAGNSSANYAALAVASAGTTTSQAAIAIQQLTSEGDTIIFGDYEPYIEYNFMHENASNVFHIHSGGSTNNLGSNTFYNRSGTARTGYIKWSVYQDTGDMHVGGSVGVGTSSPAYKLDVSGTIRATGDVIAYSDRRVKQDIVTLENSVELIQKLRGVSYKKIGESEEKIGVIAQEILEVLPQVVSKDENGMYSVAYGNMAGLFIEAIKQQQTHIETLEARIQKLEQLLTQKP